MKNWKTTLFGIISAVGLLLLNSNDAKTKQIGNIISIVGTLGTGAAAKDNNVTGGTKVQSSSN